MVRTNPKTTKINVIESKRSGEAEDDKKREIDFMQLIGIAKCIESTSLA